jgi:hypothetical protein
MKRASLIGVLALGIALFPATGALAAPAAPTAAGPVTYHGTVSHATRTALSTNALSHLPAVKERQAAATRGRVIPFLSPGGHDPASRSAQAQAARIHGAGLAAPAYTVGKAQVSPSHQFNGLSDADQAGLNGGAGFEVTPPDQGLCVGRLAGIKGNIVVEAINSAVRFSLPDGTPLFETSLAQWFNDPFAQGDPRCLYDPATKSFYFTEIGYPAGGPVPVSPLPLNTTLEVAVLNASGALANYSFDTSQGQTCFGDQPKTGFSNSELVVSTDEYCGAGGANFEGAIVLALSKAQLAAEGTSVSEDLFGPVTLAGIPGLGLDPAINTGSSAGYLVNSFPFDASGANNPVSSSLGLWSLKGDTLTGRVLSSEPYAFPIPAVSTGTGSTDTNGVTSEAALNPDDSRLSGPVNVTRTASGDVQLWTALDSAVAPTGDPTARDGAAWFKVDTGQRRVTGQGYVGVPGAYLIYPALQKPASGAAAMVFTITSPTIDPGAAFTTLGSGAVKVAGAGTGPHLSFADVPFGPRWGDYSFTALDPGSNGVWLATEYIPPTADQDPADNWGTYVFEVSK